MSNIDIVKVILSHIGEDPTQDKAIAQGCIALIEVHETIAQRAIEKSAKGLVKELKELEESATAEKTKKPAPRKRKPFDTGKMKALLDGGWPVTKIADEMGCSPVTIYDHMKKEGLAVGKVKED